MNETIFLHIEKSVCFKRRGEESFSNQIMLASVSIVKFKTLDCFFYSVDSFVTSLRGKSRVLANQYLNFLLNYEFDLSAVEEEIR